jgi:hypothetical protein
MQASLTTGHLQAASKVCHRRLHDDHLQAVRFGDRLALGLSDKLAHVGVEQLTAGSMRFTAMPSRPSEPISGTAYLLAYLIFRHRRCALR